MKKKMKRKLIAVGYTLAVTAAFGRWLVCLAYLERGYKAYGGEYFAIAIAGFAAWKAVNYLFEALEELEYERNCKKRRGRGASRIQDNRWTVQ